MRVLVTGGTGYLGQAVVRALADRGHTPVVFARGALASGLPGVAADGDVRDLPALTRAVRGCDALCHMAALVSVWRRRAQDFDDVNIGGLRNALAAAASAGISRIVYTSSFLARPPVGQTQPLRANDYQRTKAEANRVADVEVQRGHPMIRLYPGVIYGPGRFTEGNLVGRLIRDHLHGRLPGLIGADRPWSYAWIDDVAAAHAVALERAAPGSSYVLGGVNVPQMDVFEQVRAITGRRLPRRIPFGVAKAMGVLEEARAALFRSPPLLTRGVVEIFAHDWSLDSRGAINDLDFCIRPLKQGVAELVASL